MIPIIFYFLPAIILLGILTSYEDIKERKIRNKYVVTALVLAIAINAVLYFGNIIVLNQILDQLIVILFSLVIGIVLWLMQMWSAGDAKLYIAFVALIPSHIYQVTSTQIPTGDLLINIFVIAAIYTLIKSIKNTSKSHKKKAIKDSFKPKDLGLSILSIYAVSWITQRIFIALNMQSEYILNIILIGIIIYLIRKMFEEQHIYFLIFLSILRLVINQSELMNKMFFVNFAITLAGFLILINIVKELSADNEKKVNIYDLKPGMILVESFDKQGLKKTINANSTAYDTFLPTELMLDEKLIKTIRHNHLKGKLHFNSLRVIERSPFAQYVFIGVIVTILTKGNFILFMLTI